MAGNIDGGKKKKIHFHFLALYMAGFSDLGRSCFWLKLQDGGMLSNDHFSFQTLM
jgi:hypothetical protein